MIPVKLQMRNFMCYRDNVPPLHFDSIHVACISGNNGSGKSALIDAVTWALWGQSRASSDDELVYSGQAEMSVEFDFAVKEQLYRVIRKRSRPKRASRSGQTIVELQMATGDGFKPISGDSATQTQQKINQILHMDYETFINSAFLRQGHADEFTKKRPGERKQVLASILQLSIYDGLEEQAKDLAKQQESEITQLENAIKEIEAELARTADYKAEFEKVQGELAQIEQEAREQETRLNGLRQEKAALEAKKAQLDELEARIRQAEKSRDLWSEQVKQQHSRIGDYERVIAERAGIETGYARLAEAKKSCHELDQKLKLINRLNEHKHRLEMAILEAGKVLSAEHAVSQSRIRELEKVTEKLPQLRGELEQTQHQSSLLLEQEAALQSKKQLSQGLRAKVNYLEADKERLEKEIEDTAEKLNILLSSPAGVKCPLCDSELGAEGRKRIESKYIADRDSRAESLKSKRAELAQQEKDLKSLEGEVSRLETRLNNDRVSLQSRTSVLNKSISEAEEAAARLTDEREKLAEIEQHLAGKDFALTEQAALARLETEIAQLSYNSEEHEQVRSQMADLEQYEALQRRLEEADRLIVQEREAMSRAEDTLRDLQHNLEADNQRKQTLTVELGVLPQLLDNLAQAESEHQALLARQRQAQEVVGGVKARLERCAECEIEKSEKEKRLKEGAKLEGIYRELSQAFGKKGMQAMLIEMAIPEIEIEANKLLARMTDNRMHVKIETQRETRKGDVLETLDINISDELGTRNYEMFSGGEAFRIDFAIRIALSRLLARRAGAPLPTLIIDEGFGTQDSAGIEKIKEAINAIQDDFEKILVITHVPDLRDAFPTRIEVVKEARGSTLYLS